MFWGVEVVVGAVAPGTVVPTGADEDPKLSVSTMTASMPRVATTLRMPSSEDPRSRSRGTGTLNAR
jgi:hypothetical protein